MCFFRREACFYSFDNYKWRCFTTWFLCILDCPNQGREMLRIWACWDSNEPNDLGLSVFLHNLREYQSVSSRLLLISQEEVIRGSRELLIKPQENQKFTEKKTRDETDTVSGSTAIRLGLIPGSITYKLYEVGNLPASLGLIFLIWKMWLFIVVMY